MKFTPEASDSAVHVTCSDSWSSFPVCCMFDILPVTKCLRLHCAICSPRFFCRCFEWRSSISKDAVASTRRVFSLPCSKGQRGAHVEPDGGSQVPVDLLLLRQNPHRFDWKRFMLRTSRTLPNWEVKIRLIQKSKKKFKKNYEIKKIKNI